MPLIRDKNYLDRINAKLRKESWTGIFAGTCR